MTTPLARYDSAIYARTHSGGTRMNQVLRVLLDFVSTLDPALDEFAGVVVTGNAARLGAVGQVGREKEIGASEGI
ncbi:MAG: hypothetical protein WCH84_11270 [Verrucomicrobiota bacterium]